MALTSQQDSRPKTYHTGGQEHRHIVTVSEAHLWETKIKAGRHGVTEFWPPAYPGISVVAFRA